ncbi:MAG: phytanoyl-CoA dioxygenase family protein [Hyphomicrobiales bacterium]|nr:phytanoyl-CoA dioxygenase family protein [Hyphomicrobiales bacterium]
MDHFQSTGAELHKGILSPGEMTLLKDLAEDCIGDKPAVRITGNSKLSDLLRPGNTMDRIARARLGDDVRPVRAILFDKRPGANWALGWHQDRTIAVAKRIDVAGFDHWSVKSGMPHVEPPFEIIAKMVTLRAHLDACGANNAPLTVIAGSHRFGRLKKPEIRRLVERSEILTCEAEAGDVWAYATAIVHASKAAREPKHRRVLQVDFSAEQLPDGLQWLGV